MTNQKPDLESRVTTAGNSVAVVIPAKYASTLGIRAGDAVQVYLNPQDGEITYKFLNIRQLNLV